ncbi:MAG: ATP-binding cassette domain-containing protein, partial [Spirochaetaceae bacterium]|nr:ATP-binding cassette domain-containing protein [Spirochaetaceae bacterium]
MEQVKLSNISFSYDEQAPPALNDVSITVEKNKTLCVAGANGCGKSTLLQIIAGCIKPERGEISAPGCGIVFQ